MSSKSKDRKKFIPLEHKMVLLDELFQQGAPVNNTTLKGGKSVGNLSAECMQFIAVKTYQDWKPSQIATALGVSTRKVSSSLRLLRNDARKFFELRIVVRIESFNTKLPPAFLCRLHGEQFPVMSDANNHCWYEVTNGQWA
jgi:hypothetical protein